MLTRITNDQICVAARRVVNKQDSQKQDPRSQKQIAQGPVSVAQARPSSVLQVQQAASTTTAAGSCGAALLAAGCQLALRGLL